MERAVYKDINGEERVFKFNIPRKLKKRMKSEFKRRFKLDNKALRVMWGEFKIHHVYNLANSVKR